MFENDNLLIDLNTSSSSAGGVGIGPTTDVKIKQESTTPIGGTVVSTASLMQTTIPIYKLLSHDDMAIVELSENNPFDKMDKQAGLFNDPFEIVSNAAMANNSNQSGSLSATNVETGLLISIDSPTDTDRNTECFRSDANSTVLSSGSSYANRDKRDSFNLSPISSRNQSADTLFAIKPDPSPTLDIKPFIIGLNSSTNTDSTNSNNSVPSSMQICKKSPRSSEKMAGLSGGNARSRTKSNSFNLLKYSLSNSRGDESSANEHGSPCSSKFNELSKLRSSIDESFEDLSATMPNWIDSSTDIDVDSEFDSDIEKLNIPMLNKSLSELELKADANNENPAMGAQLPKKFATPGVASNRDQLLKKLELIKHKILSPSCDIAENEQNANGDALKNVVEMAKQMVADNEPRTPVNQYSTVPEAVHTELAHADLKYNNPNALIENLQRFIEKCNDRNQQEQANDLLKGLSSILTAKKDESKPRTPVENPPRPQPIVRQRTFSIDRKEKGGDSESNPEESGNVELPPAPSVTTETEPGVAATEAPPAPSEEAPHVTTDHVDPGLSHVIKELQQVWGNQPVNVLQANIPANAAAVNLNPTYIVVMGTPSHGGINHPTIPETPSMTRPFRSQSLTAKVPPAAAIRAVQNKSRMQAVGEASRTSNHTTTPQRAPTLTRRSSFGSSTVARERVGNIPALTPIRRRSIQYTGPNPTLTPLSKSRLSTSLASHSPSPSPNVLRRKSLAIASPARDSPQKVRSVKPTIMKPPAPPATRNLKIRVKESLGGGRSSAPLRAIVPMNRVAPLNMINESVRTIGQSDRRSLLSNVPRTTPASSSKLTLPRGTNIMKTFYSRSFTNIFLCVTSFLPGGIPQASPIGNRKAPTSPATAAIKPMVRDGTYIANTQSQARKDLHTGSTPGSLGRRRSLSDNKYGSSHISSETYASTFGQNGFNRFAPTRQVSHISISLAYNFVGRSRLIFLFHSIFIGSSLASATEI